MDISALTEGLAAAKVDFPIQQQQQGAVDEIIENIDDNDENDTDDGYEFAGSTSGEVVQEDEGEEPQEDDFDLNTEEGLVGYYSQKLGYEGEVEGTGVDALLFVAQKQLEKANNIANDPRVQAYLAHVKEGGNLQTYDQMQPTNRYGAVELDESETDITEAVVRETLIVLRKFDDEEEVNDFIDDLKDKGTLFAFAEKNLPKLQKLEESLNEERKGQVAAKLKTERDQAVTYFKEVKETFNTGLMPGVIVDKKHLSTVRDLSIPNKDNVVGIESVLDNLTPAQVATMNTLAYCLANKQAFTFNPAAKAAVVKASDKPVHQILAKGKASNGKSSNSSLANFIDSTMRHR